MPKAKPDDQPRELLVFGEKTFKITIPGYAKVTFGPFSPPGKQEYSEPRAKGTLRVYGRTQKDILACFTGVTSFRDSSQIEYSEQVAKEEGATLWKSDRHGYTREEKVKRTTEWVDGNKLIEGNANGDSTVF